MLPGQCTEPVNEATDGHGRESSESYGLERKKSRLNDRGDERKQIKQVKNKRKLQRKLGMRKEKQ